MLQNLSLHWFFRNIKILSQCSVVFPGILKLIISGILGFWLRIDVLIHEQCYLMYNSGNLPLATCKGPKSAFPFT